MNNHIEYKFDDIKFIKLINNRSPQSQLISTFREIYNDTKEILANRIPKVFDQYTIHDIGHSFRIMEYMYSLIEDPTNLDDLEIIILCYSALLHDIGMAVTDDEILAIKQDNYLKDGLKYSSFLKLYNGNQNIALQEFIRKFHAKRSADYVEAHLKNVLRIPNHQMLSFWREIGKICQSHNESYDWIIANLTKKEIRGKESFNPQFCACLLRLGDILDIDDQRTPFKLYEFIKPIGYSDGEWRQHYLIYNYEKISQSAGEKVISFFGHCDNPKVHRRLLSYFDWVDSELKGCNKLTISMEDKYHLPISENLQIDIKSEGYTFADNKISIDFKAVTSLLIGEKIYGDKKFGLRELIQNGIDACDIRLEEEAKANTLENNYIPTIWIIIDKNKNIIKIKDNGIGMTLNTIKNHFLNVGSSYYKSNEFKLKNYNFNPIGNFGIGFLACFMLSPSVKVVTRHINSDKKYEIDIEEHSEYTSISELSDFTFSGTEVTLNYNSFVSIFSKDVLVEVKRFLESNFIDNGVNIQVFDVEINFKTTVFNNLISKFDKDKGSLHKEVVKNSIEVEGYISYDLLKGHIINDISNLFDYSLSSWPRKDIKKHIYVLKENFTIELIENNFNIDHFIENESLCYFILTNEKTFRSSVDPLPPSVENTLLYGDISIIIIKISQLKLIFNEVKYDRHFRSVYLSRMPVYRVTEVFNLSFRDILIKNNIKSRDVVFDILNLYKSASLGVYLPYIFEQDNLIFYKNSKNILSDDMTNDIDLEEQMIVIDTFRSFDASFSGVILPKNLYDSRIGDLFLKNVFVSNANIKPLFYSSYFVIKSYRLNLFGDDVFTNISRSSFDSESNQIIHSKYLNELQFQIINDLNVSEIEKTVLKEFFGFMTLKLVSLNRI